MWPALAGVAHRVTNWLRTLSERFEAMTGEHGRLTPEKYRETRVDFKIEAYRQKAVRNRWGHLATATVGAIAAATVPVLINVQTVDKSWATLLSLVVMALVAVEGVFHFREHWKNYDLITASLRMESYLYQTGAGPYHLWNEDDAFVLFVERVEYGILRERFQTINMRTSVSAGSGNSDQVK